MEKPVGKKQRKSRSQEIEIIGLPEIQCQECHHHHPAQVYPPEGEWLLYLIFLLKLVLKVSTWINRYMERLN